jgi:RNA polymerase sigma-70 factor, ECF subfamily
MTSGSCSRFGPGRARHSKPCLRDTQTRYGVFSDVARAEELAQDTFVALLEGAGRYESRARFRAYLFAIAYNVLLADQRKSRHAPAQLRDEHLVAAVISDPDAGIWVRAALATLDQDDREILMLREYEQLSYDEIATLRATPINTVRSRLFRARMALKAALEREVKATDERH